MSIKSKVPPFNPNKTVIVFDFDGTMVETEQQVVSIINGLRRPFGIKPLTLESFRNRSLERHILGLHIFRLISPLAVYFIQKKQTKNIRQMRIEPGLLDVMRTLSKYGYQLGIISSNSLENVTSYLTAHQLSSLFAFVEVADGLYGKGEIIKTVMKEHAFSPDRIVYVGDEVRDVEAAVRAGVKVIAVTWGFQAKKLFKTTKPDWLVDTPKQLLELFVKTSWWKRLFMLQ